MALTGTIPNPFTVNGEIENAYAKVVTITHNTLIKSVEFIVYVFNSETDRDGDNPAAPISTSTHVITGSEYNTYFSTEVLAQAESTISQAYQYLKTLEKYNQWQDC